jgi:hypothetical protein
MNASDILLQSPAQPAPAPAATPAVPEAAAPTTPVVDSAAPTVDVRAGKTGTITLEQLKVWNEQELKAGRLTPE